MEEKNNSASEETQHPISRNNIHPATLPQPRSFPNH